MSFHNHDPEDPQGFIKGRNEQIRKETQAPKVISSEPTQEELWKELIALTMIRRPWSEIQSKFEINRKKS